MSSSRSAEPAAALERWQRFEGLLDLAEQELRRMHAEELRELARLYRLVMLDLAAAQRANQPGPILPYLNGLVLRGRRLLHRPQRARIRWRGLWELVARDFPRMVRTERRLIGLTGCWMLLTSIMGYLAMEFDPAWLRSLFPELFTLLDMQGYARQVTPAALASGNIDAGTEASVSAFIAANNIRVSLYCYAFGVTWGLGTLYFLSLNGALLGAVGWHYLSRDAAFQQYFYAGILPHGVWELTAIALSAAAGLMLGRALILPGDRGRLEALRQEAPRTLPLVGGVVLMLLVAGLIEGYVTPSAWPDWAKITFGLGSGVLFILYILLAGRDRGPEQGRILSP